MTSPEGLKARLEMTRDPLHNNIVQFQMFSADGSHPSSLFTIYPISDVLDSNPQTMVFWCNQCQFFIAKVEQSQGEFWPRQVCGGIPKATACDSDLPTECWWLQGENQNYGTFRRTCDPSGASYSVCTSGTERNALDTIFTNKDWDALRIVRRVWTSWSYWDGYDAFHANDRVMYPDGVGIHYDALIAWSLTPGVVALIQGQLWDCFMDTIEYPLDCSKETEFSTTIFAGIGGNWTCFMKGPKGSTNPITGASLWLFVGQPGTEGNIVY
jgi:hypothetical protein